MFTSVSAVLDYNLNNFKYNYISGYSAIILILISCQHRKNDIEKFEENIILV